MRKFFFLTYIMLLRATLNFLDKIDEVKDGQQVGSLLGRRHVLHGEQPFLDMLP